MRPPQQLCREFLLFLPETADGKAGFVAGGWASEPHQVM